MGFIIATVILIFSSVMFGFCLGVEFYKEEIILIARSTDYTLSNIDNDALFEGKIAPHCANVMTRQEAIEVMAKAICHHPYPSCEGCIAEKKKKACKQAFEGMKELAEAALNALLGVKK